MIDDIIILDDVIPIKDQDFIENYLLGHNTGWKYNSDLTWDPAALASMDIKYRTPGMGIAFNDVGRSYLHRESFDTMRIIADAAVKKINFDMTRIYSSRTFMHFPLRAELCREYDNPHVDNPFDHLVCLYYVNDTDGDTFMFNKRRGDSEDTELVVTQRVTPKKGRALLFNGNIYHASSVPTQDVRVIINFNIV